MGGNFTVEFEQTGKYQIEISRWPFESGLAINDVVKGRPATLATEEISEGRSMNFTEGGVQIGAWKQEKKVNKDANSIVFEGNFTQGKTNMSAWFTNKDKEDWGAFYIRVYRL
jgi:hypothetical protein